MQFTLEEDDLELISEYIKNGKLNELDDIVLQSIKEAEGWFPEIPNFIESIRWMFTRKNVSNTTVQSSILLFQLLISYHRYNTVFTYLLSS